MPPSSKPGSPISSQENRGAFLHCSNPASGVWFCALSLPGSRDRERESMHCCRRSRLTRVLLPQRRHMQHHLLLPAAPSAKQSLRLAAWGKGLVEASGGPGSEDATNTTTAADRVHFWRRGPSLRSLAMTDNVGVAPSRQQAVCRFERYLSTAAEERQSTGSSPPPPPLPPSSLQKRLGISDAEAETVRKKDRTSKNGFENLITVVTHGRVDEQRGDGSTGTLGPGSIFSDSPTSLPSPQPAQSYSCLPAFLLDGLHAKPKAVKSLVLRRPAVLGWSAVTAEKLSRRLQESLGMQRSEVARMLLRHPEAGKTSAENNIESKVRWLRDNLDLGEAQDNRGVVKVLLHNPLILNLSIERSLDPMLLWLEDRLGVSRKAAAKIARDHPVLFGCSIEANLEPTLAWLQERLEMDDVSVAQMVAAAPNIICLNVHSGVEPKLAWLRDRVGLSPLEVCFVLRKTPTILYVSVEENLEPTLAWLKTHLDLDDEAAREMFLSSPRLVLTSLENNLKLTTPWLQRALGMDAREAVELVRRSPMLLQCSIKKNLEPTVAFFREEMNASQQELRESVLRNPMPLTSSLDGRLRPRVAAMREANIEPVFSEHRRHVGRLSDAEFTKFINQHGN